MFSKIDKNNDGYITFNELKEAFKDKYSEETLEKILRAIDTDKNGAINYTEFIAATMTSSVFSDDQKITNAFEILDKDGDGYIEERELAELVGGQEGVDTLMRKLISEVDGNSDNKIDLHEFKLMIKKMQS